MSDMDSKKRSFDEDKKEESASAENNNIESRPDFDREYDPEIHSEENRERDPSASHMADTAKASPHTEARRSAHAHTHYAHRHSGYAYGAAFENSEEARLRLEQRRKRQLIRRLIIGIILFLLGIGIGLFLGKKLPHFGKAQTKPAPSTGTVAVSSSGSESASSSAAEKSSQTSAGAGTEESSSALADPDGLFSGTAMPNANTGNAVQSQKGTAPNHNRAAGIYAYQTNLAKEGMYEGKDIANGQRIAFLTYDDGVNSESTPLLLDTLKQEGVPATFFIVGKSISERTKPLLERIYHEGHALALHSFNHNYDELYPGRVAAPEKVLEQYQQTVQALQSVLGSSANSYVWRYPGGHMSWKNIAAADQVLKEQGVAWVDWNSENGDAKGKKAPKTTEEQLESIVTGWKAYGSPNTICILMHDTVDKPLTRESVSAIVSMLREKGFSFGILE